MNQIREVQNINQEELARGISGTSASWHSKYANSAWVFVGNLEYTLTEGDVVAVLSEYGEIDDFNLVRDEETGKSKGFAFCKYEDARSCVLAVDNLGGVEITNGRTLRVDHVESYRLPKSLQDKEEELQKRLVENEGLEGHAYDGVELENEFNLKAGQDLFAKPSQSTKKKKTTDDLDDDPLLDMERQEEKRKRKEERARIRQEREERRREKRAKKMAKDSSHRHSKKHKKSKRDDKDEVNEDNGEGRKHKKSKRDDKDKDYKDNDDDERHSKRQKKSKRDDKDNHDADAEDRHSSKHKKSKRDDKDKKKKSERRSRSPSPPRDKERAD